MENTTTVSKQNNPASLLELAITNKVDVAQLEKFMDLYDRYQNDIRRKEFLSAKSSFQSECPQIKKTKIADYGQGKAKYKWAPLGDIADQIKKPLAKFGLSYSWEFKEKDKQIICVCILSHSGGHSERTEMSAEHDTSGSKNSIQSKGSTMTYLERYTLIGALGIATADEDSDANLTEPKKDDDQELADLKILFELKQKNLSSDELKRAKEVIRKKEKSSYLKLRNFLATK